MRDAAIRNADPALILWYSYQDIVRSDDPERRWGALSRAAFAPTSRRGRAAGALECHFHRVARLADTEHASAGTPGA